MGNNNYTLGRGEVFLGLFLPGTKVANGERYIGNTPKFDISVEATNLDHYSSDRGVREKDESIVNQINRTASVITDSINVENVGLFFFGNAGKVATVAQTGATETLSKVIPGLHYQLGANATRPQGVRKVASVVVAASAGGTPFLLGTDYNLDTERARVEILKDGSIPAAADVVVTYNIAASTRSRVISGNKPVEGCLRYIAHNPDGDDYDYFAPYVRVRPNGDYALKSDEWQQMPLSVEIMKLPGVEALYIDGQPYII